MRHLFISREYPPSPYTTGGIGTYVEHVTRLFAEAGETVHVIAQQWPGAPKAREESHGGRLTVHRVPLDQPPAQIPVADRAAERSRLNSLRHSHVPAQAFMWNAALLAEWLIEHAGIDVVEAQEYEAPTYFLMARRGTGSAGRAVPVLIHLHTPTEFILEANGWTELLTANAPLIAAEQHVIRAADALLCPSHFLARAVGNRYRIPEDRIHVLPYPAGHSGQLERDGQTWRSGTLLYVGRMEPRKGVGEWVDAASDVARQNPALRFEMIGGDTWHPQTAQSVREATAARIPPLLRTRFEFLDAVPRRSLQTHLRRARLGVVPSRWENFPFSCIEAMASGLPVLVSACGGMAEMVEDGRTGWIADDAEPASLAAALRRALATPAEQLEAMGAAAAAAIGRTCNEHEIARRSLSLRRDLVGRWRGVKAEQCQVPLPLPLPMESGAMGEGPAVNLPGDPMSLLQILQAPRPQQRAVLRRALRNPGYILSWLTWHMRRG